MKLLHIRKLFSIALVVCIISGNSVDASAAEQGGSAEIIDQPGILSEEVENVEPISGENAEEVEGSEDGAGDLSDSIIAPTLPEEEREEEPAEDPLPPEQESSADSDMEGAQEGLPVDDNTIIEETGPDEGSLSNETVPDDGEQADTGVPDLPDENNISIL